MEATPGRTWKRSFAMSKNLTRVLVALLLLVTFTAGAAQASPWSLAGDGPSAVAALWDWLAAWFRTPDPIAVPTEGCGMDPNGTGGCHNGTTTGGGGETDPNG